MPNAIEQRLASRLARQKIAMLGRSERAAVAVGRVYSQLLRDLLALAGGDGVTEAVLREARDVTEAAATAARETVRRDLAASVKASRKAAIDVLVGTLPLRWFRAVAPELAAAALPEAVLPERDPGTGGVSAEYDFEPIARRRISRDEAMALIRELAFHPLSDAEVEAYLAGGANGIAWDERLRHWDSQARGQMLSQLVEGVSLGEDVTGLRKRLQPIAEGVAWKAQRIARTESRRVAERAQVDTYAELGDMTSGMQVIASLDQWTRPHHAARHGKVYRRRADGGFVADDGEPLPELPDEPNCRCYLSPLLAPPEEFLKDPALRAEFANDQNDVIPDPAAYTQWFSQATEKDRALAVGVRRYRAMERRLSGTGQRPEWPDFLDSEGRLLSVAAIRGEKEDARAKRKTEVAAVLDRREQLYREAAGKGAAKKLAAKTQPRLPEPAAAQAGKEEAKTEMLRKHLADMRARNEALQADLDATLKRVAEKRAALDAARRERAESDREAAAIRAKIEAAEKEARRIDRKLRAEDRKRDRTY